VQTYIEFKDGTDEVVKNAAPSISTEQGILYCIDKDSVVVTEEWKLSTVKQVIFETED
jgi:hypothetical protein